MPAPARHLLGQDPSAGPHGAPQDRGVRRIVALPDVLAHLDTGHRVELAADLTVVAQVDLDVVLETAVADPFVDEPLLLRGDGHTGHPDAAPGGIQRQRAPAELGRASCREGVCPYVEITVGAVSLKKKTQDTI